MADWVPLAVVVVAVLGGCAVPLAPNESGIEDSPKSSTPMNTPIEDPVVSDVAISKTATFDRVEALMGVEGTRPPVNVTTLSTRVGSSPTKFQHLMGVSEIAPGDVDNGRYLVEGGRVVVNRRIESRQVLEMTLVHGYVHALQYERGILPDTTPLASAPTTDARLARLGLLEGGAVWITDRYVHTHLPTATRQSTRIAREYREGPAKARWLVAPAHFGWRYVDRRIASPRNLSGAYEDPAVTTEQLIHGHGPSAAPPANLTLTAATDVTVRNRREDVQGELAIRTVLRSELSADRARAAAAGWDGDRLREFSLARPDSTFGIAWVIRWDTPGDAEEFLAAFGAYADRRADDTTDAFRATSVTEATVVVFAGPPTFVDRGSASGSSSEVHVSFDDSAGERAEGFRSGASRRSL